MGARPISNSRAELHPGTAAHTLALLRTTVVLVPIEIANACTAAHGPYDAARCAFINSQG